MTSKPDLGVWIAGVGAVTVIAAIIAGLVSVGGPGDARAQRIDEARLATMQQIATAAQCAYTFTNKVPVSIEEIRTDFVEHRAAIAVGKCDYSQFTLADETSVSYQADGEEHIKLCAEFRRASRPKPASGAFYPPSDFPELEETRAAPGRHCYRVRLVKQIPLTPANADTDTDTDGQPK